MIPSRPFQTNDALENQEHRAQSNHPSKPTEMTHYNFKTDLQGAILDSQVASFFSHCCWFCGKVDGKKRSQLAIQDRIPARLKIEHRLALYRTAPSPGCPRCGFCSRCDQLGSGRLSYRTWLSLGWNGPLVTISIGT